MLPENRVPTHPGEILLEEFLKRLEKLLEILLEEFLKPLELTQVAFAEHIGVPVQRVNEIVRAKRGVTPETAWLFSQALGTTPQFWLNLQSNHDLALARPGEAVTRLAATA